MELGIALRHIKDAAGSWTAVTPQKLQAALRNFEIKRSSRCSTLVSAARAVREDMLPQRKPLLMQAINLVRAAELEYNGNPLVMPTCMSFPLDLSLI